ncbi:flagellar assembly protein FliH [Sulfurirhabdus autotrophica]|uniref:Flagellar assembly protein FliH n=1 Tax=Sulfurirhabdus autotrophica TaxID=1706046 RepID=A0A4V6P411_9PROT|nr:flagellar assembly protein FliH [Sulfurirhabdus autotrophica]TCV90779.1 flagellar assembly protein FliH [Sulfurirhabdus autotrophica]
MSNNIIPKEKLSAYQRWELNSLDETLVPSVNQAEAGESKDVHFPTAEEVERIHQQAYEEGYATGYHDGKSTAQSDAERMGTLLQGLEEALAQIDQQVAEDLGGLAIEIARQMLHQALKVKPELITTIVREAIKLLPVSGHHPHLLLHPEDAVLVRSYLEADLSHSGYKIIEDSRIDRGGCRIENSNTDIDATLESRWKIVVAALGRDDSWLG